MTELKWYDGVFRTLKVQDGVVVSLSRQLEKLIIDCERIQIVPHLPSHKQLQQLIEDKQAHEGLWRLKLIVTAEPREAFHQVHGKTDFSLISYTPTHDPLHLKIYPIPFHRLNCKVKGLDYQEQVSLLDWAHHHHCDDVLIYDDEGTLLNLQSVIFFLKIYVRFILSIALCLIMRDLRKI